jgi:hypothetical protein
MGDHGQRALAHLLSFQGGDAYEVEVVDYH